jgi:cytochrome c oxidase subunit 1
VYTYLQETGWGDLNLVATGGAVIIFASVVIFLVNALWSLAAGPIAGDDPWASETLEWATSSPPPSYNFAHIPVVESRDPLWTAGYELPVVTGLRADRPEVLLTTALDALPDSRHKMPGPSIWPLMLALAVGVTFITLIFTPWGIPIGTALSFAAFAGWTWPRGTPDVETIEVEEPA